MYIEEDIKNLSGVYKILNKINGKFYIGSTTNLRRRFREHLSKLKCNRHHNIKLQNAYKKYGKENFEFCLVEECEPSNLEIREQYYIDTLNPEYNMSPFVIYRFEITEEFKKSISIGLHKRFSKEDFIQRGIKANESRKVNGYFFSIEGRKKISEASKKKWENLEYVEKMKGVRKNVKLTEEQVRCIKLEYIPNVVTIDMLAEKYGITRYAIKSVLLGKTWKWVI